MSIGPQHQGTSLSPTPKTITSSLVASVPWTAPSATTVVGVAGQIGTGDGVTGANPQAARLIAFYS